MVLNQEVHSQAQWGTPVIPELMEAEAGGMEIWAHLENVVRLSFKIKRTKGVDQWQYP